MDDAVIEVGTEAAGLVAPIALVSTAAVRDRLKTSGTIFSRPLVEALAQVAGIRLYARGDRLLLAENDVDRLIAVFRSRAQKRYRTRRKKVGG